MANEERKPPLGRIGVTIGAALTALAALCTGVVQQQETPIALSTGVSPDGETNQIVFKDRVETRAVTYNRQGHGQPPEWTGKIGPLPGGRIPAVPKMGWNPPYVAAVASGSRPLYYCVEEVRQYDRANGTQIAPLMAGGLREMWDDLFDRVSSIEDCSRPDFVMGANAEVDCNPTAWGCAWFNGRTTRVTFNGTMRAQGTMDDNAIKWSLLFHEGKHALDFEHSGQYGNEPGPHSHLSDMGYVGAGGHPVDNPTGRVAVEDYHAESGPGFCCGLRPKAQPTPQPTARPTPTPTPTPQAATLDAQFWVLAGPGGCPHERSGAWCVATIGLGAIPPAGGYAIFVRRNADGSGRWLGEFQEVVTP